MTTTKQSSKPNNVQRRSLLFSPCYNQNETDVQANTSRKESNRNKRTLNALMLEERPSATQTNDSALQSNGKRRRYMRRGSRCPSMLMIPPSVLRQQWNLPKESALKLHTKFGQQQRRLSVVSALRLRLEKSTIVEARVPSTATRISPNHQRSLTLELLSKV